MTGRSDAASFPAAERYSPQFRTALVLTGTGTAGAYHAGVLRALHEAGVKLDVVAGCGIGVIGALFAAIDGAQRLWEDNGFWRSPRIRSLYGWRFAARVIVWALGISVAIVAIPLVVMAAGLVVFPVDFLLRLVGAGGAEGLVGAYLRTAQAAFATLDRVAAVATYAPSVSYPNNGFAQALRAVAGVLARGIGTRVFWVQTGGYDTHAGQATLTGSYNTLMTTLNDGLIAFYNDLSNQGLLNQTLVLQFSEFGRRIQENGSQGTDHGAASVMLAIGGQVRGGIYGTAANLTPDPGNPTLENAGNDIHYQTDFRSVYARVIDGWLGADSNAILGGDFRSGAPNIL